MIVNRTGRGEHEVSLLAVGLIVGLGGLLFSPASPTIKALGGWGLLFFALTFVSSCITLAGIFLPWKGVKGFHVERAGLFFQAAAWIGYALAVLGRVGFEAGFIFVTVAIGLSTGHLIRAFRIPGQTRQIAAAALAAGVIEPEEER